MDLNPGAPPTPITTEPRTNVPVIPHERWWDHPRAPFWVWSRLHFPPPHPTPPHLPKVIHNLGQRNMTCGRGEGGSWRKQPGWQRHGQIITSHLPTLCPHKESGHVGSGWIYDPGAGPTLITHVWCQCWHSFANSTTLLQMESLILYSFSNTRHDHHCNNPSFLD